MESTPAHALEHTDTIELTASASFTHTQGTLALCDLPIGKTALIRAVTSNDYYFQERLNELGLIVGTTLTLTHKAPFGGTIAFEVRGTLIALRTNDAQCVRVICL